MEPQWYAYQNKVALGFLEITFSSLRKVTRVKKSVCFSVIASESLKSSLFDICRTRLDLKAWSPYIKDATVDSRGRAMEFSKNNISVLQN